MVTLTMLMVGGSRQQPWDRLTASTLRQDPGTILLAGDALLLLIIAAAFDATQQAAALFTASPGRQPAAEQQDKRQQYRGGPHVENRGTPASSCRLFLMS